MTKGKTRKNLPVVIIFIALVALIFAGGKKVLAPQVSFYEQVGHPLKFFIISKHSKQDRSDFRNQLLTRDTNGILMIDRPQSVADTDVILVLLQSWADVSSLPLQEDLVQIYQSVKTLDPQQFRHSAKITLDDGKPVLLTFYNDSAVQNGTRNCYARDFISGLQTADGQPPFDFDNCVASRY